MAKSCKPNEEIDPECKPYSGGQCSGAPYAMRWTYDIVTTGADIGSVTDSLEILTGSGANTGYQWIRGKLGCISAPLYFLDNKFVYHTVKFNNGFGDNRLLVFDIAATTDTPNFGEVRNIVNVKFQGVIRMDGLPDNCGDFNPNNETCKCEDTDQEISCSGARGGICCIAKSKIAELCAKV
jgi:hypothetical protein